MKNPLSYFRTGLLVLTTGLLVGVVEMSAFQQDTPVQFSSIAEKAGIHFRHENGATPEKYLPETMGSGGLFFDYNNDGWLDIFLVNGGSFFGKKVAGAARDGLYRNTGGGKLVGVAEGSGVGGSRSGKG